MQVQVMDLLAAVTSSVANEPKPTLWVGASALLLGQLWG